MERQAGKTQRERWCRGTFPKWGTEEMKNQGNKWMPAFLILLAALPYAAADYPLQPVPFTAVRITGGVLGDRQRTNARSRCRLHAAVRILEAAEEFRSRGRNNARRAAGKKTFQKNPVTIFPFDDSDVYKAIEGAAFCLSLKHDPELVARLDRYIAIAAAQEPDGYLYTFRTMHPDSPAHGWIGRRAGRMIRSPVMSFTISAIFMKPVSSIFRPRDRSC